MKDNRLQTEPVPGLLFSLALPAVCAQIVTLLYNMVDRMYIGRMADGAMAMAGVGLCTPVITAFSAIASLFGRGGAPLVAISMGRREEDKAEAYLGNGFLGLTAVSLALMALVLGFQESLLTAFGAGSQTLPYAMDYLGIYCLGTVFVQITVGMNYYITTQGFAGTAMMTTMLGGILNIFLDPVFMFALGMGVKGAALATVLSQMVSCLWVMSFLLGKRTRLRLKPGRLKPDREVLKSMLVLGSAPFFMRLSEGVLQLCFNRQAERFGGDIAVSAMSILFSMYQFILLPIEGVAQGSQPIISYNYGASRSDRVKETIRLAIGVTMAVSMCLGLAMLAVPGCFIRIFSSDKELVETGSRMLRVYILGCLIMGANSTCQQTYNSLGEGKKALFFAFLRKILLLIPLLYLLPELFPVGILAVVAAEPAADLLTTISNVLYFRRFLKRKLSKI